MVATKKDVSGVDAQRLSGDSPSGHLKLSGRVGIMEGLAEELQGLVCGQELSVKKLQKPVWFGLVERQITEEEDEQGIVLGEAELDFRTQLQQTGQTFSELHHALDGIAEAGRSASEQQDLAAGRSSGGGGRGGGGEAVVLKGGPDPPNQVQHLRLGQNRFFGVPPLYR